MSSSWCTPTSSQKTYCWPGRIMSSYQQCPLPRACVRVCVVAAATTDSKGATGRAPLLIVFIIDIIIIVLWGR